MDMRKIRLTLIIVAFLGLLSYAYADLATLTSPLIWRLDNSGAFSFPKPGNGVYAPSDFIATEGQISSITVNWESAGEISFEVSADNGLHYYPVVNGLPLKSGFVSGNRLRWRATELSDDAKLSSVKISYTDSSKVLGDFGEPSLSEFKYRKEISIKNSSGKVLYNYQIKLNLGENSQVKSADFDCAGHLQSDFKDIRFTAADAQTPLPYYIESLEGAVPKRLAVVWVKVPQIPKNGISIYLYYGKDKAEDLSSPEKTFDFYDDFKGQELNLEKWNVYTEQKGSYGLANGKIKLDAAEIVTKDFKLNSGIIEYGCELETGFENSLNSRETNLKSYNNPYWSAYSSIYKGAEHCIAVDNIVKANDAGAKPAVIGAKYNYRVSVIEGKVIFERFDSLFKEPEANVNYQITPVPKSGYLSFRSGGDGSGKNNMYFGPIRVRKTSAVPPAIESVSGEEIATLPVFSNTAISNKGNIILKESALSGYYLAPEVSSGFEVSILVPDWQVESGDKTSLSVGFSTDKGLKYIQPCEKGKYYYASKKDFAAGQNIKSKIEFSRFNNKETSIGVSKLSFDYREGKIIIISPNGKEEWAVGMRKKISWSASEYDSTYPFDISYSTDKGKTFTNIITNKDNDGQFFWVVPEGISNTVKIKVCDSFDKSIFDTSDAYFSIVGEAEANAEEAALSDEEALIEEHQDNTKKPEDKKQANTQLYDLLIKVGDNVAPNATVDKRASYKEGDIVMIRPAGYIWGAEEKSSTKFVIIQAYLTPKQAEDLMTPKKDANGKLISRRQYKVDLRKQGIRKFLGGIEKPKSIMDAAVVETRSGASIITEAK